MLENGVPIRPVGFCNVNEMFEINTEQADSIEILRGPSNSLYGSSAVHGAVNVLQAAQADRPELRGGIDAGGGSLRASRVADVATLVACRGSAGGVRPVRLRQSHARRKYRRERRAGTTGCLYSRPDDRADSFDALAPKLALSFAIRLLSGARPHALRRTFLAAVILTQSRIVAV
jgi:outer membrane receptor protein involved in Fe transport